MTQHETTRVHYDTTRVKQDPTRVQTKLGQQKQGSTSHFLLLNYIFFLFLLEIVNLVLHVILFQPFKIPRDLGPSEMREELSIPNPKGIVKFEFRKECVLPECQTPCTKLSGLPKIKLKIAIGVPKTHIYTLFRVLSTTTTASEN